MPYPYRIQPANTLFHVYNRGDHRQTIFRDDGDCMYFLQLIKRYKTKIETNFYHYILMPNHFHFELEIQKDDTLSKFMQGLGITHTISYNNKYQLNGHVWQGRFRSKALITDESLLRCGRYIELNPVRAGIVKHPADYRWSSYHAHANRLTDSIVDQHALHLQFSSDPNHPGSYRHFIESGMEHPSDLDLSWT